MLRSPGMTQSLSPTPRNRHEQRCRRPDVTPLLVAVGPPDTQKEPHRSLDVQGEEDQGEHSIASPPAQSRRYPAAVWRETSGMPQLHLSSMKWPILERRRGCDYLNARLQHEVTVPFFTQCQLDAPVRPLRLLSRGRHITAPKCSALRDKCHSRRR